MALQYGRSITAQQIGRISSAVAWARESGKPHPYTLPDVTVWTAPGEHHEIKHKAPTAGGSFGLEVYRFDALLWFAQETGQRVMYTIHNHALAGGRDVEVNDIAHWQTANVIDLNEKHWKRANDWSWIGGERRKTDIYFWRASLWSSLAAFWLSSQPLDSS